MKFQGRSPKFKDFLRTNSFSRTFQGKPKIQGLFKDCGNPGIRFVAVDFRSEEEVSWRRGPPVTYFCPALDPPLDGSGRKTTTLVRDLEYFIHPKFHQNPSSGSGEEVENVNSLTDDGRRTTDAGQRMITIGHWSLWLLCPKKVRLSDKSDEFRQHCKYLCS